MKKEFLVGTLTATLCLGGIGMMTSCTNEDPVNNETNNEGNTGSGNSAYVIAATVDDASYLVTASSLDEGEVSLDNSKEVIDATYWVYKDQKMVFALVYNKGGSGTGASYYLDGQGDIQKKYDYTYNRITTYGTWGENVVTVSTGDSKTTDANGNIAQALLFNYLNESDGSQSASSINAENFLGNGETVSFSGVVDANSRVYTSVIPMGMRKYGIGQWPEMVTDEALKAQADGGSGSSSYEQGEIPRTQYPDSAFVAIYNGSSFSDKPVIARTGKIGYACGRMRSQYYQTIWAADNGDIYVFSPGYGRSTVSTDELKAVTGQLPSGVMRIKAGETDFDSSYYVNLEEIGTKHPVYRCWHATEDYFLLQLYKNGAESMINDGTSADVSELAVFKGEEGTITLVSGLPADMSIGGEPFGENGAVYIPVNVTTGDYPAFYKVDVKTGQATKGLSVKADQITTAGVLNKQE